MAPGIAVLGWGSLLWDGGDFDACHGPWFFDGPVLDLEFSRLSKTRQGALTLVLDPEHGTPNRVAWSLSKRASIADAAGDLRRREGTGEDSIGRVVIPENEERGRHPRLRRAIYAWAIGKRIDVVLWTDLPGNFSEILGKAFSIEAALEYLRGLPMAGRNCAEEYFARAPSFIRTPLRDALQGVRLGTETTT